MVDDRKVPVGYKVTEVGVIPENWDVKKLGEIGEPIIGLTYKPENIVPYGMLVLRSSNIDNNRIDLADNVYVDVEVRDRLIVEENDLLICVRNGSRRLIGKCALISKEVAGVTFGAFMSLYKSDFSRYIFQYFQTNSIKIQIEENMGATINQITNKSLSNFVIAIPQNHNEQESIIEALTDTDNLIQSLENLIDKKKKIKQGMMQQLLTGKKRLPGFSGEWEEVNLGDICSRITTGKLDANAMKTDGIYRFYTCAKEYYWIDKYSFDDEALLISGNGANVGYIHYYKGKFNAYQRTYVLTGFFESIIYVKYYLEKYLADRISAEVNAGNTPYIKMDTLTDMIIKLPPQKDEQIAIAQVLSDMDLEIEALEEKLKKYKTIKQGMMQELLTGRIRLI